MNSIEVMVMISNPADFISWLDERKVTWYERVMQWHDYVSDLYKKGKVRQLWGSHQLLSRIKFTVSQSLLIAVYRVNSWREFDELLLEDPLRGISQYVTIPLTPLFDDRESDTKRFETAKQQLLSGKSAPAKRIYSNYRSLYRDAPDFVGKFETVEPENPPTNLDDLEKESDPLQILLIGFNPPELITLWDDTRKFIHYEKVQWWHDYTAMMLHQGKISHVWGTHDFCDIEGGQTVSAAAVTVFRVPTYDEFDEIYKLDPIRDATIFWSVLLQPIADQRRLDEARLNKFKTLLGQE